jgi:putative ABC transport system permease protein
VGFLGGTYPALVLSGFQPARVLKANRSLESKGSTTLRNALVVLQFTVSIALIVATVTVYGQMLYATSMDAGFNKEQLITLSGTSRQGAGEQQEALIESLRRIRSVTHVTAVSESPFSTNENNTSVTVPEDPEAGSILIGVVSVDYEFLDALQVDLVAGRNYNRDFALDAFPDTEELNAGETARGNLLINESAVRRLGFGSPQAAVGREIRMDIGMGGTEAYFTIVGVVADMHMQSLKRVIRPEVYTMARGAQPHVLLRFSGNPGTTADAIAQLWSGMFPEVPLEYDFVDDVAAEAFGAEKDMATMLGTFSALAVVIACLGLYGLASFTAERRTKEIGIRRVLGAGVKNIVGLLLWQFSKPVLLANLLAWPVAVWSMRLWLESFPYRLNEWLLLPLCIGAGLIALLISWFTVGGNAARVARRSPVEALRYE